MQIFFEEANSDQLAFVWRAGSVLESTRLPNVDGHLRLRVPTGRFRRYWDRRRSWGDPRNSFSSPYAREVRPKALNDDNDSGVLCGPQADRRQALPFGKGGFDLRPKARNWTVFVAGFFPRRCARRSRVSRIHRRSALVYLSPFTMPSVACTAYRHFSMMLDIPQHENILGKPTNMGSGT